MLRTPLVSAIRQLSSKTDKTRRIVVCANGAVAAWHPPQDFPYEHTKPIDLTKEATTEKSVLSESVQKLNKIPTGPNNTELREIFYTEKHEWFTRTRENRLRSVAAPTPRRK